jgi:integrase
MDIEVRVRERASGRDVGAFCLHWQAWCRLLSCMLSDRIAGSGAGTLPDASPGRENVALAAQGNRRERPRVDAIVSAWKHWMVSKNYARRTMLGYVSSIRVVLEHADIVYADEIAADRIVHVLEEKTRSKEWGPATHNKYLAAARCFAKWLRIRMKWSIDLSEEQKAKVRDQGHARAITTRECRDVLEEIAQRARLDNKVSGFARLFWGTCMMAGLRPDEPWRLQWRHVELDHDVPHWVWTKGISKNNRTVLVAMHPALAAELRKHREAMRVLSRAMPTVKRRLGEQGEAGTFTVDPSVPESLLFPEISTRHFITDVMQSLGMRTPDKLGHVATPRSLREWFITMVGTVGTPDRICATLTRHAENSASHRMPDSTRKYEFHELVICRQWITLLPNVFEFHGMDDHWGMPTPFLQDVPPVRANGGKIGNSQGEDLTSATCVADDSSARRGSNTHGLQDQLHRMSGLIGSTLGGLTESDPAACETAVRGRSSPNRDQRDFGSTRVESANQGDRI